MSNHITPTEDVENDDEDVEVDNWLQEEPGENDAPVYTATRLSNEEDVSFSDLEDEDDIQEQKDSK